MLLAYSASRVLTASLLALAYWRAVAEDRSVAQFDEMPDFLGFLQSWDGQNYRQIALEGYPDRLPRNGDGDIAKNTWAFLPLYPLILRVLLGTGADIEVLAVGASIVFGGAAAVVLHRLLLERVSPTSALWGAVLFSFAPLSFVLQVAYAESLFLLLLFSALLAMEQRRYLVMIPLGVAAAFAHPGALALPAAIGLATAIRLYQGQRMPRRTLARAALAALLIAAAGFSWPLIAAAVTGQRDAYFLTELAWWRVHIGEVTFVPFTPWFLMADRYGGWAGIVAVAVLMVAVGLALFSAPARKVGTTLTSCFGSYLAYLFAVSLPQQSIFRMQPP